MPKTVFQLPFVGSLDEKTRAEILEPGAWFQLENVVQQRRGSYSKRSGNVDLAKGILTGGNVASGVRLLANGNELLLVDGHNLYSWASTITKWSMVDRVPEPYVTRYPAVQTGTSVDSHDVAIGGGAAVISWLAFPEEWAVVLDRTSLAAIVPAQRMHTLDGNIIFTSFVVAVGSTLIWVGLTNGAGHKIYARTFDASGAASAWGAEVVIASDFAGGAADVYATATNLFVVYANTAGANRTTILRLDASLGSAASASYGLAAAVPFGLGVTVQGTNVWIASTGPAGTDILLAQYDPSTMAFGGSWALATLPDPSTKIGIVADAAGAITFVATTNPTPFSHLCIHRVDFISGVFDWTYVMRTYRHIQAATRPFTQDGRVYCWVQGEPITLQKSVSCVDVTIDRASAPTCLRDVARPAVRLVNPKVNAKAHVPEAFPGVFISSLGVARTTFSSGVEICALDFTNPARFLPAPSSQTLAIAGGVPSTYDGNRVADLGFAMIPHIESATSAGFGDVTGNVSYVVVWEWFDAHGLREQSAPSLPVPFVGTGDDVRITVSTLPITTRQSGTTTPVRAVAYRTLDGGTTYFRVPNGFADNANVDTLVISDDTSDSGLSSQEPLYFQPGLVGGRLPKFSPPSWPVMASHRDRLFGIADDGITLWWTGQNVLGERPWTTDLFQLPIPEGGRTYGLISQEGRLFGFKKSAIFVVDGDGPPDNGVGGEYQVTMLPTDVGCTNPRSLVAVPDGIVFIGPGARLYILNRALQVVYIGRPVQATVEANPVITSAVLQRAKGRVYFTCTPTEGDALGVTICWDYIEQTWTVHKKPDVDFDLGTTTPSAGAVSATLVDGSTYVWMTPSGRTYSEDDTQFLDAGAGYVTQTIETPEIKLSGLQGYQKVWRLSVRMKRITRHDLRVSIAFDGADTYEQVELFTDEELEELVGDREQLPIVLMYQTVQSVRVKLEELTPKSGIVGTGEGAVFLGLAFEVAAKTGIARRPGAASR